MKKKNLLTLIVSLALVLALGVGATLAYLTATDGKVVNTFKFANNMIVTLKENTPTSKANESVKSNANKGYDYTNVTPGQDLDKEPVITVNTSVDAYVFVKVSGFDANLKMKALTEGWETSSSDVNGNGVYYKAVNGAADVQDLGTLFTTVTVGNVDTTTTTLKDVTIQVAAIQQSGFADAATALASATFQG